MFHFVEPLLPLWSPQVRMFGITAALEAQFFPWFCCRYHSELGAVEVKWRRLCVHLCCARILPSSVCDGARRHCETCIVRVDIEQSQSLE